MANDNILTRTKLNRIIKIHKEIKSGTYPNTTKLSKSLEISTSTISLDIKFLRTEFNAPIMYDQTKFGYYYSKPFELPFDMLSDSDMELLTSARVLLSRLEGSPIYDELYSIIDMMVPNDKSENPMINRITVPPVAKALYDKSIWDAIYEAMKTNQIIEFDYDGLYRKEITHRRVRPYQLVMNDGQVYLFGYSEERQDDRIFSLTRISNIVITKDQFELPEDYDFSKKCNNGKFGFFIKGDKTKLKIRFFSTTKQVVQERLWGDDQEFDVHDDYVDLTFSSNQPNNVLNWVLSLGPTAKPLEPEWFVQMWKDSISDILDWNNLK